MRVRFLQTTPSAAPDAPFQPGQMIDVPGLTREIRDWLKEGYAVVVPDALEAAAVAAPERAVHVRAKARTA